MTKTHTKTIRFNDNTNDKINAVLRQKNMSFSEFANYALNNQADMILMGKETNLKDAILYDIWERISFVQVDLLSRLNGENLPDNLEQKKLIRKSFSEDIQDKITNKITYNNK